MGTTVCVGGLIAAGKTTLIESLSEQCFQQELSCKLMPEIYTDAVRSMLRANQLLIL